MFCLTFNNQRRPENRKHKFYAIKNGMMMANMGGIPMASMGIPNLQVSNAQKGHMHMSMGVAGVNNGMAIANMGDSEVNIHMGIGTGANNGTNGNTN